MNKLRRRTRSNEIDFRMTTNPIRKPFLKFGQITRTPGSSAYPTNPNSLPLNLILRSHVLPHTPIQSITDHKHVLVITPILLRKKRSRTNKNVRHPALLLQHADRHVGIRPHTPNTRVPRRSTLVKVVSIRDHRMSAQQHHLHESRSPLLESLLKHVCVSVQQRIFHGVIEQVFDRLVGIGLHHMRQQKLVDALIPHLLRRKNQPITPRPIKILRQQKNLHPPSPNPAKAPPRASRSTIATSAASNSKARRHDLRTQAFKGNPTATAAASTAANSDLRQRTAFTTVEPVELSETATHNPRI